ncbi:hypothetical protein Pcinc_031538 [Petrolisthes cinctipes]|uniref:Uncharacterized protein n=1 Tax=Petrolisthes cinctipes TaxID=88211 RepID=A0AAE1EW72_PETCI|nr:hypothetical protein Pcinc_031538 [Petrolisthes cinctipes]
MRMGAPDTTGPASTTGPKRGQGICQEVAAVPPRDKHLNYVLALQVTGQRAGPGRALLERVIQGRRIAPGPAGGGGEALGSDVRWSWLVSEPLLVSRSTQEPVTHCGRDSTPDT